MILRSGGEHRGDLFELIKRLDVGGRHGLMGKQNLYEHIKPPLVVVAGSWYSTHGRSDALVYLFDLVPDDL